MHDYLTRHKRVCIEHDHKIIVVTTALTEFGHVPRLSALVQVSTSVVNLELWIPRLQFHPLLDLDGRYRMDSGIT